MPRSCLLTKTVKECMILQQVLRASPSSWGMPFNPNCSLQDKEEYTHCIQICSNLWADRNTQTYFLVTQKCTLSYLSDGNTPAEQLPKTWPHDLSGLRRRIKMGSPRVSSEGKWCSIPAGGLLTQRRVLPTSRW